MGIFSRFKRTETVAVEPTGPQFAGVEIDAAMLYGEGWNLLGSGSTWTPPLSPRVSRTEAMSVPAVKRARDLICSLGALPIELIGPDNKPTEWSFFAQPEAGVPGVVTWTNIVEDMLFEKVGWLRKTMIGWHNKPIESVHLDPRTVTVRPDFTVWTSASGHGLSVGYVPDDQLIRFDSPNDALLRSGARAIRSLLRLDSAASNHADGTPPIEFFTPDGEGDPFDSDEEARKFLQDYRKMRREGLVPYVPYGIKHNVSGFNPEQLQLVQAREFAITEIARLTGIDTEEFGVSTTSRTYFNAFDRTQSFIQFTLNSYMRAIEQRLSMDDVSPRGYKARFKVDDLFRADTLARYQAYEIGERVGAITDVEIRESEGRPPLTAADKPKPAPVPAALPAPADKPEETPADV